MKHILTTLLLTAGLSASALAAGPHTESRPGDPCSPGATFPPTAPCDRAHSKHSKGKPMLPAGGHAAQRLYPAPDGKGDSCTQPWSQTSTGQPYCPGDIVE